MKILLVDYPDYTGEGRLRALEKMGHDVLFYDHTGDRFLPGRWGKRARAWVRRIVGDPFRFKVVHRMEGRAINSGLLKAALAYRPDFVIVVKGSMLTSETLGELRERLRVPMACYFVDPVAVPELGALAQRIAPYFDVFFLLDEIEATREVPLRCSGIEVAPHGVDPEVFRPIRLTAAEKETYDSDVCFVGIVNEIRRGVIRELARMPVKVRIWGRVDLGGRDWAAREPEIARCFMGRWVPAEEMARIYSAAKIVFNLHGMSLGSDPYRGMPLRTFEIPACRVLMLADDCAQIRRVYRVGEEVDVYDSVDSLKEKVRFYLDREDLRISMAEKAYERTLREHTWECRLRHILDVTLQVARGRSFGLSAESRRAVQGGG
ncbi:MAG: glycosyltransferase [Nitrospirae bacterium]|nr:glycosyltransferase [Nitrospirota bacterium]